MCQVSAARTLPAAQSQGSPSGQVQAAARALSYRTSAENEVAPGTKACSASTTRTIGIITPPALSCARPRDPVPAARESASPRARPMRKPQGMRRSQRHAGSGPTWGLSRPRRKVRATAQDGAHARLRRGPLRPRHHRARTAAGNIGVDTHPRPAAAPPSGAVPGTASHRARCGLRGTAIACIQDRIQARAQHAARVDASPFTAISVPHGFSDPSLRAPLQSPAWERRNPGEMP